VPLVVALCQVGNNVILPVLAALGVRGAAGAPPRLDSLRCMVVYESSGPIYNLSMKRESATDRKDAVVKPTAAPDTAPTPHIRPIKREWRHAVLEAVGAPIRS
jgi:hypothetical protein